MEQTTMFYAAVLLVGVFLSAISQVMFKKSCHENLRQQVERVHEPLVIIAYTIFVGTTLLSVYAYKGFPLSMGPGAGGNELYLCDLLRGYSF